MLTKFKIFNDWIKYLLIRLNILFDKKYLLIILNKLLIILNKLKINEWINYLMIILNNLLIRLNKIFNN